MDTEEQKRFLRFVTKQLRACHHELIAYRAVVVLIEEDGIPAERVKSYLAQARKAPEIHAMTDAYFARFDELIEQHSGGNLDHALIKMLEQYRPDGEPN